MDINRARSTNSIRFGYVNFNNRIASQELAERAAILPFVDFISLFNHAPVGMYGGLSNVFGSLNYNYANAAPGHQLSDLYQAIGRLRLATRGGSATRLGRVVAGRLRRWSIGARGSLLPRLGRALPNGRVEEQKL